MYILYPQEILVAIIDELFTQVFDLQELILS